MACAGCQRKTALQAAGYEGRLPVGAAPETEASVRKYGLYLSVAALCAWYYFNDRPRKRRRRRR
jgi:hypothetical protein